MALTILTISLVMQVAAASAALSLARRTGFVAWLLLSLGALLLAVRGAAGLYQSQLLRREADAGQEAIVLLCTLFLLVFLILVRRQGGQAVAGPSSPPFLQRLSRAALLVGISSLLGSGAVAYFAYDAARETTVRAAMRSNRNLARTFRALLESAADFGAAAEFASRVRSQWEQLEGRRPGVYLCVVGADGKLAIDTAHLEQVGADVSDMPLRDPDPGGPATVGELLREGREYSGRHLTRGGERQIVSMVPFPRHRALLAVHVPWRVVMVDVREAAWPLAVGLALLAGVLLPISLAMLHWAYASTERARATARSHQAASDIRYQKLVATTQDGVCTIDGAGSVLHVNARLGEMLGCTQSELVGTPLLELVAEGSRATARAMFDEGRVGVNAIQNVALRRKDGEEIWTVLSMSPLAGPDAMFSGVLATMADSTPRRRAARDLRASEARLAASSKMDAIGRLAGGVAHDFNNLLTAILGFTGLAMRRIGPEDPMRKELEEVRRAGTRAAALTGQLLAFGRRQALQPRVVYLNDVLAEMVTMLRRLLGEETVLETVPAPALWPVYADPGQIEQVVVNLAINGRDAMPRGGHLTIATSNLPAGAARPAEVPAGECVVLEVHDEGVGMDAETLSRIFEPFFTTKEFKQGSGLGLAMVHGIVKQSGGAIVVESAPGKGSVFRVFLPRTVQESVAQPPQTASLPLSGRETVLVVEDERGVRRFLRLALERYGYTVLEAEGVREVHALTQQQLDSVGLLLTDVVMPGLSGPEVANALLARKPGLKVLFVSGYAEEMVERHGAAPEMGPLLHKPFTVTQLLESVRAALDGLPLPRI